MRTSIRRTTMLGLVVGAGLVGCESAVEPESTIDRSSEPPASSALSGDYCRGTVGPITVEKIIVPSGSSCTLQGTRVQSDVEVKDNAALRTEAGTYVGGNIKGAESKKVIVLNTYVNGNIQTDKTGLVRVRNKSVVGGNIQLKQGGGALVEKTRVDGDLQLEQNGGLLTISYNRVYGNLQVFGNTGGVRLVSNRVAENLQCKENRPAPTGSGNLAGSKEDQCAKL